MKKRLINQHGLVDFDNRYFGAYYKKYTYNELIKAYRWFKGWIRLMDKIYPIKKGRGKKVLEVGCGIGAFSKILEEREFSVTASDISLFIIQRAKKLQNDIKFVVENVEEIHGKEKEFDLIFALEVFEHLVNPKQSLRNLKRRMKSGGMLIFSSPYPTKRTFSDPTHINVHSPKYWIKLGKELGFKDIRFQYVSFLPFLYRYSSTLSRAFPIKTDLPIIVNTCFFYFRK